MFKELKDSVSANFNKLAKQNTLFYKEIDRDLIFQKYLDGFKEEHKQEHNCNCCKSFLRQFGGICAIIDNKVVSIWDNIPSIEKFDGSVKNLQEYIASLPVTDIFLSDIKKCGTDKTPGGEKYPGVVWSHLYFEIKDLQHIKKKDSIPSILSDKRSNKEVLKRSLEELTLDSVETILELIGQGSLYRGKEFEGVLNEFKKLKIEYTKVDPRDRDNYCWLKSTQISSSLAKIRNTAIGTLLIDLSAGLGLDDAVTKFERVMAPANYKRPTALVTPKMVQEAKEKLTEMGLLESMDRRFANVADLNVENLLFTDKSSEIKDVFDEVVKDSTVNPKTLSKVEEININDFLEKVLPNSKSVEVLLENGHLNNLVSILTCQDKNAKSMFKWNNPFSWSYTGGITDSMKERVKAAGGKVDGVLRFSIQWNEDDKSIIDLDAHAHEPEIIPSRGHICYSSNFRKDRGDYRTPMTGQLDVDMINPTHVGVENITWTDKSKMKPGVYKMRVHNYSGHTRFDGVRCEVEFDGELHEFAYNKAFTGFLDIAEVTLDKKGTFTIKSMLTGKSSVNSKEKWGVKTNTFVKVKNIMLSPNHWEKPVGNKHYFFTLDGCVNDESPRPFFNEFLKEELNKDRKVFEILGSKVKIPDTKQQLSGVGFSETQRNHVIVRVQGKFKRNLKLMF